MICVRCESEHAELFLSMYCCDDLAISPGGAAAASPGGCETPSPGRENFVDERGGQTGRGEAGKGKVSRRRRDGGIPLLSPLLPRSPPPSSGGAGRALSRCSSPVGAADSNPGFVDSKHATPLLGAGRGGGRAAGEGRLRTAGAGRDCTRRGAAAGLAEPSSSCSSLLVSGRQAAPSGQLPFESRLHKFCY